MTGFTEIHTHVVFGVDDGAQTQTDMQAMLDSAHAQGVSTLFATPHVTPGVRPFDFDVYRQRIEQGRAYCRAKGYAIELRTGAEILCTPALERYVLEGNMPALEGSNRVLMEFGVRVEFEQILNAVRTVERGGYAPVLAHIERYPCLQRMHNAWRLKDRCDVAYQVNARTVLESNGFWKNRPVRKWLEAGLIDWVASDAHDCVRRPFLTRAAYEELCRRYGAAYAGELLGMREMPGA